MHIAILSVNHKLAPIAVREKIAFTGSQVEDGCNILCNNPQINACIILSTCNRLEIYVSSSNSNNIKNMLADFLTDYHKIGRDGISQYLSYFENNNAIEYICKVASGLSSLVLGEPQIFGQLKSAYKAAKVNNTLDKALDKVFQHVFSTAKRVRTDTNIGKHPISIAYCGVRLSEKIWSDISQQTAILVGSGETIELSAQHLTKKNIKHLIIANRTRPNAEKITKKYGGFAIDLTQLTDYIHQADILISSTASPIAIIGKGMIENAIKRRKHKPMFILDLAVPRDIEPETGDLEDVYLYTVDDLNQVINDNFNNRGRSVEAALDIIRKQNKIFNNYLQNIPSQNLIGDYIKNAEIIKQNAVKEAIKGIKNNDNPEKIIKKLADQLTNKLLHKNLINIKQQEDINKCSSCIPKI